MAKERKVTKTVMRDIAGRLASGETLVSICRDEQMPSYRTVTRAVQADDELWDMYHKARILQAEYYGDHIIELATAPLPAELDAKVVNAEVQRRRLEIDSLKWTFARSQPFGLRDKKEDAAGPKSVTLTWLQGDEVAVS
jgi:hypothetical protein